MRKGCGGREKWVKMWVLRTKTQIYKQELVEIVWCYLCSNVLEIKIFSVGKHPVPLSDAQSQKKKMIM